MTSGRIRRIRASATRIFQPPESAPTSPSIISWLKPRPDSASRARPSRAEPARSRVAGRAGPVHDLSHGAAARHLADILAEIADRNPAIERDLTLVRRFL